MGPDHALSLITDMLWNAAMIAGPLLLITLIVGLLVSVFQVATQIQEITLSYVPKTVAAGATLIVLGPWMISKLTDFARSLYQTIPSIGG